MAVAFPQVTSSESCGEITLHNFPALLQRCLNENNSELGHTFIWTTNGFTSLLNIRWKVTLHFVKEEMKIYLTLQILRKSICQPLRDIKYSFRTAANLNGRVVWLPDCNIEGRAIETYKRPQGLWWYEIQLEGAENNAFVQGIRFDEVLSNDGRKSLKLHFYLKLTNDADFWKIPSVPLWTYGDEPFTLTLITNGGWIKTQKLMVAGKCQFIRDLLKRNGIGVYNAAVIQLPRVSFQGMQHLVRFFFKERFDESPDWIKQLPLIIHTCEMLQMGTLRAYCSNAYFHGSTGCGFRLC